MKGLEVGDKFDFSIAPADAYGEYVEDHVLDLPKNIFEVEGKFDSEVIKEGNTVPMMDSNGNRLNGSVLEVKDDWKFCASTASGSIRPKTVQLRWKRSAPQRRAAMICC